MKKKIDGHIFNKDIVLEKELSTTISVTISFKEYNQQTRVLNAYTDMTGFVSGTEWKTSNVDITKNKENSYNYEIIGTKDWKLLGIRIYTQLKDFKGTFKI